MAGYIQILIKHHKRNKIRARKFPILRASMAAAALVTLADNEAHRREAMAAKRLVETLDALKIYRSDHGLDLYKGYLKKLNTSPEKAKEEINSAISEVKDDPEEAAMVVMLSKTISEADGIIYDSETESIEGICDLLGINSSDIDAFTFRNPGSA